MLFLLVRCWVIYWLVLFSKFVLSFISLDHNLVLYMLILPFIEVYC